MGTLVGPYLDVSDVLLDPTLVDRFRLDRRIETINNKGRSVTRVITYPIVLGVVTMSGPDDLERLEDQDRMRRVISVVTRFPTRGPSVGFKADVILWRGDSYLVETVDPYPQYGYGFVQVIAASMSAQDKPAPMLGILNFADASQSAFLGVM